MTNPESPQLTATLAMNQTLQQAIAQHQAGRLQEAESLYREVLQARPNHPEANHNMGALAVQMKLPAAGLQHFMAALEADPARVQYWLSYIDALIQADHLEAAQDVLALVKQQGFQGDEIDALAHRLENNAQVSAVQSNVEKPPTLKDSPPISLEAPQQDRQKIPSNKEINGLVALFAEARYLEAETLARTMTMRFPLHGFGWKVLGAVFKQTGRHTDALAPMQKAVALSPGDVEAHNNLGISLYDLGRLSEAEASFRQALQINPDYAAAHGMLNQIMKQGSLPDYLVPEVFDYANGRLLRRYRPRESNTFIYIIEIVGTCNLRCPSCPVGNSPDASRPKGFMDLDLFRSIVEKIKQDRVVDNPKVWLFNWGEPLLHPRLPEMIAILRKNGLYSMLSTNLNIKKNLEEVIRSNPDEIKISLSGLTQALYSKTHVKGNIELVKENMRIISELINTFNASTQVWVGQHVYRNNIHECAAVEKMCKALNFGYAPIQAFYQPLEKMMDLIEGKASASETDVLANFITHPLDALALKRKTINNDLDCELRFNMTTINYDGSVALCCGVYDYQNMLGVNFLEASHDEIQALKYRHPLCKKCYACGLQYSEPMPDHECPQESHA